MARILKQMGWTREFWRNLPVDEQEWWLANDRYEQREMARLMKARFILTEDNHVTDPAAYLALIRAQM